MFGRFNHFADGNDEFIGCFGRERGFAILRTDPRADVRYSNRNAIFTVLKRGWSPLFRNLMLTTNWNGLARHNEWTLVNVQAVRFGRREFPPDLSQLSFKVRVGGHLR